MRMLLSWRACTIGLGQPWYEQWDPLVAKENYKSRPSVALAYPLSTTSPFLFSSPRSSSLCSLCLTQILLPEQYSRSFI